MGSIFGYARVSSREQNEDRQIIALKEMGVSEENIYTDKLSGKDFNRPGYQKLVKRLKSGDLVVVKSIDRLGRDYQEILEEWRKIVRTKGADIEVIDLPLLNTTQEIDGIAGVLIADILLRLLAYVSQTEREFIKQRQAEGIAAAKARGQRFGRPPKDRGPEFEELKQLWKESKISATKAAQILGVTHVTFLKWARED